LNAGFKDLAGQICMVAMDSTRLNSAGLLHFTLVAFDGYLI
jgi:hypothetical protein